MSLLVTIVIMLAAVNLTYHGVVTGINVQCSIIHSKSILYLGTIISPYWDLQVVIKILILFIIQISKLEQMTV